MALWTPAQITTALWLQADDLTAGALATWTDDSGNGRNATQGTGANQPTVVAGVLNSLSAVRFDGTNDWLGIPFLFGNTAGSTLSIFVVARANTAFGTYLSTYNSAATQGWALRASSSTQMTYAHAGHIPTPSDTYSAGYRITEVIRNGNSIQLGHDGILPAATGLTGYIASGAANTTIGARDDGTAHFLDGDVAEIVLVASVVDTDTRQKIEGYLAHKWGLEGNLDAGHPYKSTAPQLLSLGNTATLAGTSPVEPVERVLVHRDNAGTLVLEAQIVPDGSGVWEYTTASTDDHYVTYLAANYPPITHGPYTPA